MQTPKLESSHSSSTPDPEQKPVSTGNSDPRPIAPNPVLRLAINTAIVGGAFVVSRVLGLLREAIIAGEFGTSGQYDAYVAAFGVPDTLFLLIIGGAVGSAFIPVFAGLERTGKPEQAWNLASTLINASVVLVSLSVIVMALAAPTLVGLVIAPGLPPERQALVVDLTRILLLSPLFMGLGGWAQGILNARHNFALSALAPIIYNVAIIAGALFLVPLWGIYGLAWGVVIGAFLHFAVQVPGLVRVGMRYSARLNLRDEGVGAVGKLLLPRILGQAAFQANIIAMRAIGSFLPAGRISALSYSYLLMMLPHGVFALSLATVTFPTMAAQYAEGDLAGVKGTLARAVKVLLFLTLPSAVGLFVMRYEVVTLIFQLGSFTQTSTELVASALGYFSMGLVGYAVVEVLTRGFYALHDTATPVAISVVTVLLNIGLSIALVQGLGWSHEGLALSLSVTATLEMAVMWVLLGRKLPGWGLRDDGLLPSVAKSGAAAAAMGLALAVILPVSHSIIQEPKGDKLAAIILTAIGIGLGAVVYIGVARLLHSEEVAEASSMLSRRFGRGKK